MNKKLLLFLALLLFGVLPKALYAQAGPPPEMTGTPLNELKTEFRPFVPDPLGFNLFPEIFSTPPNIFPSLPKIQTSPRVAVFDTITMVEKRIDGKKVWVRWEAYGTDGGLADDPFVEKTLSESQKAHVGDIANFFEKSGKTSVSKEIKKVLDEDRIYWEENLGAYAMIWQRLFWLALGYDYDLYLNSSAFIGKVKIEVGLNKCAQGKFKVKSVTIDDPWYWRYQTSEKYNPFLHTKQPRVHASTVFLMAIVYHEGLHLSGVKSEYDAHTQTIWFLEDLKKKISSMATSKQIEKGVKIGDPGVKNIGHITKMFRNIPIKDLLKQINYTILNQMVLRFVKDYETFIRSESDEDKLQQRLLNIYGIQCGEFKGKFIIEPHSALPTTIGGGRWILTLGKISFVNSSGKEISGKK